MKYVPKPPQTSGSETLGPFNMANISLILAASRGVRQRELTQSKELCNQRWDKALNTSTTEMSSNTS